MALEPFCQQTNNESETVVLVNTRNCITLCLLSMCAVGYTALGYTTALRMPKASSAYKS